ncbi:MAG: PVC-type heme-binding CxxCH protein [Verrucomicrobiales bacterium]
MTARPLTLFLSLCIPLGAAQWPPKDAPEVVAPSFFEVPEGLEVTIWASTPNLFNPTNMDIDAAGRIWVAEGVNYRRHRGRRPGGDRIAVLQDTDGDGKADQSHTFVQEEALVAPLGVGVFDNVIVVSQPPDLIAYTDVDRDLKFDPEIDKREVILTGFNARNHDHSLHSVTGGPDGKWYFNNGNCGAIFTDRSGKTFTAYGSYRGGGGDWFNDSHTKLDVASDDGFKWTSGFAVRMNPDGSQVEIIGHGFRNSYEQSINSFGEVFQNDNDDPPACRNSYMLEYGSAGYFTRDGFSYRTVRRPGQNHGRAHWRQDDPGTFEAGDIYGGGSPTGVAFYENGALGASAAGTFLSCEAGRNVIFSYKPKIRGAGYEMTRQNWMNSNHDGQFVGSDFTGHGRAGETGADIDPKLFRPSDVAVGADGAIYVCDWFDPRVGGHADFDSSCSGTIYRIAPKGFTPTNPSVDLTTIEGAVTALRSPAPNVRWTGFNALKDRGSAALPPVLALIKDPDPWIAIRGVWLLPHLGDRGLNVCRSLLNSPDERTRLVAFRALRRVNHAVVSSAKQLAHDPSPAIRRDAALSMRGRPASVSAPILTTIAKGWDGEDKNYLESIGLGAENQESQVWTSMREALAPGSPLQWSPAFTKLTWRLWPTAAIADLKARATSNSLNIEQRNFAVESLAFIDSPDSADALIDIARQNGPVKHAATQWLIVRSTTSWAKHGLREKLKSEGIYDPNQIKLTEIRVPAKPERTQFSEAEVLAKKGDANRGKTLATRCTMCHQIEDSGVAYGPDLKGWVSRQGVEMAVRSIVHPSADIAHGFSGRSIKLKDGRRIDGILISGGDPTIMSSTGGQTQIIPRNRIKGAPSRMNHSLMLNADQLGLSAQDVADIVEWLRSY